MTGYDCILTAVIDGVPHWYTSNGPVDLYQMASGYSWVCQSEVTSACMAL